MKNLLIFPAAFMANAFSLSVVMIGLSLFGKPELAADFGIVHGATLALFYAFSGNARSLILAGGGVETSYILKLRCLLLIPLYVLAIALSLGLVVSGFWFVVLLVGRRACEWLAEVFLSEQEYQHQSTYTFRFFLTQGLTTLLLLAALCTESAMSYGALVLWAASPLFWSARGRLFLDAFKVGPRANQKLRALLPHFGSTAVIGISVYVLRVFIILLVGRSLAGDLFSAFALGGILGSVFAQALGPTLVYNEGRSLGVGRIEHLIRLMAAGALFFGFLIACIILSNPELLQWAGKGRVFWLAVGCSLMGSAIMVKAQRVRLRLLQSTAGKDAFGSDMLANILIISFVPFLYFGLGVESLSAVYLLGALLSWMFYSSERNSVFFWITNARYKNWVLLALVFLIFFPIFFQFANGIYKGTGGRFSEGEGFALFPIPLSVLVCYVGIVILGQYSNARLALIMIFFIFVGMLFTSLMLAVDYEFDERSKIILLLQYMLPMFALVLGQQFGVNKGALFILALSLFWVLIIVLPFQLLFTIVEGAQFLSSSLYFFSIYHSDGYVPIIFVGGYLLVLCVFFEISSLRIWAIVLSFLVGGYVSLSTSLIATAFLIVGYFYFVVRNLVLRRNIFGVLYPILFCLTGAIVVLSICNPSVFKYADVMVGPDGWLVGVRIKYFEEDYQLRLSFWDFYSRGITESVGSFFFGHAHLLDRNDFPSAYNYYFDFVYSFGMLAVLPLLGAVVFTFYCVVRNFSRISSSSGLGGLFVVVLFLLFVENSLQVGMRQPYSGIAIFFLWGVLLSSLLGQADIKDPGMSIRV